VIEARPDVLLNFRAASLPPPLVDRIKGQGIYAVAWFADDPVLYKVSTAEVVDKYDLVLHAGDERVLEMYERTKQRRGVTFPFWVDDVAFAYGYDPGVADLDLIFIGNMNVPAKRWRYDWLAAYPRSIAVFGKVPQDPAGIHAGQLDKSVDLATAIRRARLGLNISQQFRDYSGTRFDFPGLADLGEYIMPSRVLQFAAVGVPIITLQLDPGHDWNTLFPEVIKIKDQSELASVVAGLSPDHGQLRALSHATNVRFRRHYSAQSRARFLEELLTSNVLHGLDHRERFELHPYEDC
jgi:hypothetical protein